MCYLKLIKVFFFIALFIYFLNFNNAYAVESKNIPSLISSIRIAGPLSLFGEKVPLKYQDVRERLEKEMLISLWERHQAILWLKRASRYFPHIEKMLKKNNVPDDFKYLAITESALRPHVKSPKGALGFWQFLKHTGHEYDLKINSNIDERRNIFASTKAAIKYLKKQYNLFGSWTLAAASFNMGSEGLRADITEQKTDNYYKLYLPLETQRYVFRIISAKIILSNPEKYGFKLSKKDLYPKLDYDTVDIECSQDMPISLIAKTASTYFKIIKDLNPELRGYYLPKGNHTILIPKGSANGFNKRLKQYYKNHIKDNKLVYFVKKGDNLTSIANKFHVSLLSLFIWNDLSINKHIYPGNRIIIYQDKK